MKPSNFKRCSVNRIWKQQIFMVEWQKYNQLNIQISEFFFFNVCVLCLNKIFPIENIFLKQMNKIVC